MKQLRLFYAKSEISYDAKTLRGRVILCLRIYRPCPQISNLLRVVNISNDKVKIVKKRRAILVKIVN